MSTDPLKAAVERVDAATGSEPAPQTGAASPLPDEEGQGDERRDLAALMAAIERVEGLIADRAAREADDSAALERIADIAFVLHERDVERSLCDALDAAVREISDAGALKRVSAQRTEQAAELLRELSRRVSEMIAESEDGPPATAAIAAVSFSPAETASERTAHEPADEDDDIPREGLFEEDVGEDDEFAQVVAALAAALPAVADLIEPPSGPPEADAAVDAELTEQQPGGGQSESSPLAVDASFGIPPAGPPTGVEPAINPPVSDAMFESPPAEQPEAAAPVAMDEAGPQTPPFEISAVAVPAEPASADVDEPLPPVASEELPSAEIPSSAQLIEAPQIEPPADERSADAGLQVSPVVSEEALHAEIPPGADPIEAPAIDPPASVSRDGIAPDEQSPAEALAVSEAAPAAMAQSEPLQQEIDRDEPSSDAVALSEPSPEEPRANSETPSGLFSGSDLSGTDLNNEADARAEVFGPDAANAEQPPMSEAAAIASVAPIESSQLIDAQSLFSADAASVSPVVRAADDIVAEAASLSPSEPAGAARPESGALFDAMPEPAAEAEPSAAQALLAPPQPDLPLGPQDDPGDLFDAAAELPIAPPVESVAAATEQAPAPAIDQPGVARPAESDKVEQVRLRDSSAVVSSSSAKPDGPPSKPQTVPPRVATAPPSAASRPAPNDPLAAVRSLSEEEKIALFS